MTNESPLANRIRSRLLDQKPGGKRFPERLRLPRRGRIRIVLALIILFAGFKMAGSFLKSPRTGNAGEKSSTVVDVVRRASPAPQNNSIDKRLGGNLSVADVTGLLAASNPRLGGNRDTIRGKGESSVVLCYSLEPSLQRYISEIIRSYKPRYAAAVVMEPATGRVLACTSYRGDSAQSIGDNLFLRNNFPAASIFKTVTAAAVLDKARYVPLTPIKVTGRNHTLYKFQLKKEIAATEEISFEEAFAKSVNPVFGRIGMHVLGRETLADYAGRFGFNVPLPFELLADTSRVVVPGDTTYAMAECASGFNRLTSLSPLHGALIASAAAAGGVMPVPRLVDSVVRTADGKKLYESVSEPWRTCMTSESAAGLRSMMRAVVRSGTARKSFRTLKACYWSASLDVGGKTGSIEADTLGKVDWFIGYANPLDGKGNGLAIAVVTTHGAYWTVHSSYIASEVFRTWFRPRVGNEDQYLSALEYDTKGSSLQ